MSAKYPTDITPSGWTFAIWGFIYAWLALWLLHELTTICRPGLTNYLYISPCASPPWLFLVFIINMAANVTWLVLFDRERMIAGLVVIFMMQVTLVLCLVATHRGLVRSSAKLVTANQKKEVWFIRLFAQNGLAFYCTWVSVATMINLAITLQKDAGMSQLNAGSVTLAILSCEILALFFLQTFPLERSLRYTLSPYIILIVAFCGVLDNNWDLGNRNCIWGIVLLAVSGAMLLTRIILMIVYHRRHPLDILDLDMTEPKASDPLLGRLSHGESGSNYSSV